MSPGSFPRKGILWAKIITSPNNTVIAPIKTNVFPKALKSGISLWPLFPPKNNCTRSISDSRYPLPWPGYAPAGNRA